MLSVHNYIEKLLFTKKLHSWKRKDLKTEQRIWDRRSDQIKQKAGVGFEDCSRLHVSESKGLLYRISMRDYSFYSVTFHRCGHI